MNTKKKKTSVMCLYYNNVRFSGDDVAGDTKISHAISFVVGSKYRGDECGVNDK